MSCLRNILCDTSLRVVTESLISTHWSADKWDLEITSVDKISVHETLRYVSVLR